MKIQEEPKIVKYSLGKRIKFILVVSFISVILFLILAELGLMIFNPQSYSYPTIGFSEKYKKINYPNIQIKHCNPPVVRYYSTNEKGFRGTKYQTPHSIQKPTILLLGDSYTFGIGVNDGFEFASVMSEKLKPEFEVVNLGMGGWGLTQEIRVFFELGLSYKPEYIILQFCNNDPHDNLIDCVTKIENGKFEFIDSDFKKTRRLRRFSKLLSKSIIQKSNLYNLVRDALYVRFYNKASSMANDSEKSYQGVTKNELVYVDLLQHFVKDLNQKGIQLIFISVNKIEDGVIKSELSEFPYIEKYVHELDSLQLMDYLNINDWFTAADMIPSPLGHYDVQWNKVLGENLSAYFTKRAGQEAK
ncbi:MAG: SGNH/GDSL hydrolase family protein [Bacteroidetes bacterium]|nr:SGNH/GDSL hydrolase family protein [Bacteroidota bacterium]